MDKKRNFHPGYAKRPNGCHHNPFTLKMWNRGLTVEFLEPAEKYASGIEEQRRLLAKREFL